ncbi:MAG: protein kinase [Planctomycetes bacterium]|nr:protein kinase [Planctomycetota bacterium]
MLERDDFLLGCRLLRAGRLDGERLWALSQKLEAEPPAGGFAGLLVAEGLLTADELESLRRASAARSDATQVEVPAATPRRRASDAPAVLPLFTPGHDCDGPGSPGAFPGTVRAPILDRPPSTHAFVSPRADAPAPGESPTLAPLLAEGAAPGFGGGPRTLPLMDAPAGGPEVRRLGKYEILAELGRGGMGVVYKAREPGIGRLVALKAMISTGGAEEAQVARFHREMKTASSLRHPAVVSIYDIGVENGLPYFTMDLIDGETLDTKLAQAPIPLREGLEWIRVVADALEHAHRQGILHRDVKPSNIIIDRAGRPFLTDFGLAKEIGSSTRITLSGAVVGTPAYMSPEQADGAPLDPRSDLYSLGAVMYEVLTRQRAFEGASPAAIIFQTLNRDPLPPRKVNPRIHRDVETICEKALQKEPSRRYASGAEMAQDIARFLAGEPILARPPSMIFRTARWGRKHRLALGVGIVALVALGGVWSFHRATRGRLERKIEEDRRREEARARAQAAVETAKLSRGDARLGHLNAALEADPDCFEAHVLRCRELWYAGKFDGAVKDVDHALQLRPEDPAARLLRFRLFRFSLANDALAEQDLAAVADAGGDSAPLAVLQGYAEWVAGRTERARAAFERGARMDGRSPAARTGLGWCFLAEGKWGEALGACDFAVELDPQSPEVWSLRARIFLALCRYEEAAEFAQKVLERWPTAIEVAFVLAEARSLLGNPAGALEALDRARGASRLLAQQVALLRREPALVWDEAAAAVREAADRARILVRAGRAAEARPYLDALERAGRPCYLLRARLARAEGHAAEEAGALRQAADAGEAEALGVLAVRLYRSGKAEEAARMFEQERAAGAPPSDAGRYFAMAEPRVADLERGHPDPKTEPGRYLDCARPLLRALDANGVLAPARLHLATVRRIAGDMPAALRELDLAIEAAPAWAPAWLARACLLRDCPEVRDRARAGQDLAEHLRLNPASVAGRLELAALRLAEGKFEEALAAADAVLETKPERARAWKIRADALARLSRPEEARKAMESWRAAEADGVASASAFGTGHAYWRTGKYEPACDFFTRAIENNPRISEYYNLRGDGYFKTARFTQAFRDKAQAIRLDPARDLDLYAYCAEIRATEPFLAQMAASAMADAGRKYPDDPAALFSQALGLLVMGKAEACRAIFAKACELDPGFVSAETLLALAALRVGRREEAKAAIDRATPLAPDSKLLSLIRASYFASGGDLEAAGRELAVVGKQGTVNERVLNELRELAPMKDDPRYTALRAPK